MNSGIKIGIGIAIIGALFVIQDFGSQIISDPVQSQPISEFTQSSVQSQNQCDSSYPDVCIPPSPPDLDCKDIPQKGFTVLPPDPHRFDGDKDGIGCES